MKMRLLTALFAAAALSGCVTYDYAGGSAPGGYYYGRPSVEYYGPYGGSYGYGYYGYDPYGYYGGYYPYYYYPYYLYRPYRPHRPRPDHNYDRPPSQGGRPPPWRRPDGRYQDSGQVMIPPRNGVPQVPPSQLQIRQTERSRPTERAQPAPRTGKRERAKSEER